MIIVSDLKVGSTYLYEDQIYQVIESQFTKNAMRQAHVKLKIKNLRTGAIISSRFTSDVKVKPAFISKKNVQFLYVDKNVCIFMDNEDYSQYEIPKSRLEHEIKYLKEGQNLEISQYENEILGIILPARIVLAIKECEEAVAGNSVNNPLKKAVLETGSEVMVPIFIIKGEKVIIDTETGKYISRA